MKCRKCGAELPSDAAFCHKCGEKVEKQIEELQTKIPEEKVDEHKTNKDEFKLYGKKLYLDQSVKNIADIYDEFGKKADSLCYTFRTEYHVADKDDSFLDTIFACGAQCILEVCNVICNDLAGAGVENVREDLIKKEVLEISNSYYVPPFENLVDEVAEILSAAGATVSKRELKNAMRGRWSGGGYGLGGALKGAAMAGGLNMASDAVHSLTKGISNTITRQRAQSKVKRLYDQYEKTIVSGLYDTIIACRSYYIGLVQKLTNVKLYMVTKEDAEKHKNVYNSIRNVGINDDNLEAYIRNIELCPLHKPQYETLLLQRGDSARELEKICAYVHIDMLEIKKTAVQNYIKSLNGPVKNIDSLIDRVKKISEKGDFYGYDVRRMVEEKAKEYGGELLSSDDEEEILKAIESLNSFENNSGLHVDELDSELQKKYRKLYKVNREVKDIGLEFNEAKNTYKLVDKPAKILDDQKKAIQCREDIEQIRKDYIACDSSDDENLKKLIDKVVGLYNSYGLCKEMIPGLQQQWKNADLKNRTVGGVVYETKSDATIEKMKIYNGKKYASPSEAQLNKRECEKIQNEFNKCRTIVNKYKVYMNLYEDRFVTDSAVELMEKNRNEINKRYVELQYDKLDIAEVLLNSGKSVLKLFLALFLSAIGLYFILRANIIVKIIAICVIIWIWGSLGESLEDVFFEFSYRSSNKKELQEVYQKINPKSKDYLIPNSMIYKKKNTI